MISRAAGVVVLVMSLAGCAGPGDPTPPPVFGEIDGGCGVTVLTNDVGDEDVLRTGVECLIERFDTGETVVWDLIVPTVEGDPILLRYEGDGEQITIIEDTTRDAFGSGAVVVRTCDQIDDTGFIPAGSGCIDRPGEPFELPGEIWPP